MSGNRPHSGDQSPNQHDRMSSDPGDGGKTAAEKSPGQDSQEQSNTEAFDEEGAGIAPKE